MALVAAGARQSGADLPFDSDRVPGFAGAYNGDQRADRQRGIRERRRTVALQFFSGGAYPVGASDQRVQRAAAHKGVSQTAALDAKHAYKRASQPRIQLSEAFPQRRTGQPLLFRRIGRQKRLYQHISVIGAHRGELCRSFRHPRRHGLALSAAAHCLRHAGADRGAFVPQTHEAAP